MKTQKVYAVDYTTSRSQCLDGVVRSYLNALGEVRRVKALKTAKRIELIDCTYDCGTPVVVRAWERDGRGRWRIASNA